MSQMQMLVLRLVESKVRVSREQYPTTNHHTVDSSCSCRTATPLRARKYHSKFSSIQPSPICIMRRTRSLFGAAVICSMLLSSAQGDRPERKTYLRRLVDDSLASGLSPLPRPLPAGRRMPPEPPPLPPPKRTMIAQPPRAQPPQRQPMMTAQQPMMTA